MCANGDFFLRHAPQGKLALDKRPFLVKELLNTTVSQARTTTNHRNLAAPHHPLRSSPDFCALTATRRQPSVPSLQVVVAAHEKDLSCEVDIDPLALDLSFVSDSRRANGAC